MAIDFAPNDERCKIESFLIEPLQQFIQHLPSWFLLFDHVGKLSDVGLRDPATVAVCRHRL